MHSTLVPMQDVVESICMQIIEYKCDKSKHQRRKIA